MAYLLFDSPMKGKDCYLIYSGERGDRGACSVLAVPSGWDWFICERAGGEG